MYLILVTGDQTQYSSERDRRTNKVGRKKLDEGIIFDESFLQNELQSCVNLSHKYIYICTNRYNIMHKNKNTQTGF